MHSLSRLSLRLKEMRNRLITIIDVQVFHINFEFPVHVCLWNVCTQYLIAARNALVMFTFDP